MTKEIRLENVQPITYDNSGTIRHLKIPCPAVPPMGIGPKLYPAVGEAWLYGAIRHFIPDTGLLLPL